MSPQPVHLPFDNRFGQLPERLYTRLNPTPVEDPQLFAFNEPLGRELGLQRTESNAPELAQIFSGNTVLPTSDPMATAYAGHQFGHWSGTLGDGRAILLGDVATSTGDHLEVQLKGSGRTPYSRGGDGRSWLGPVIREYLISNAMPQYGVATTRALAAVTTGEFVLRETGPLPGAILTRVATSHTRVGHFEYLASQQDADGVQALIDHLITYHYPHLQNDENKPLALLNAVIERQAALIASWQALGFIHGVMNTDNASLVGETIDYGPCAFMDEFNQRKVFSSIDRQGRYAYENQPRIGHWNMAMLAQSLLPMLSADESASLTMAQAAVDRFPALYADAYAQRMRDKLGLFDASLETSIELTEKLLALMQADAVDYTVAFRTLSDSNQDGFIALFNDTSAISDWVSHWLSNVNSLENGLDVERMQLVNPAVIPRNHWVEAVIQAAVQNNWDLFYEFENALSQPFTHHDKFSSAPAVDERVTATFCGT